VEGGSAFDSVALVGESNASLADDVVMFVDGRDVSVDDGPLRARFGLARVGFEQRGKNGFDAPSCTYTPLTRQPENPWAI